MSCKICGNKDNNKSHIAKEMMLGLRDEHDYLECGDCGCLQIVTIPSNIQTYYPSDDYYSYAEIESGNGLKRFLLTQRDKYEATGDGLLGRVLAQLNPHSKLQTLRPTNINKQSKILDVGCGAGHLLNSLKEAGFSNLLGIDPFNEKDINYPNGLTIEKKSIDQVKGQWDLIMFNHSFEHVPNQHEVLQSAARLLAPNGNILIRVPTVSSYAWETYGVNWVQLDAPRHFFLHSIESMRRLAEKNGLQLDNYLYDSFAFQFWGSEQYKQNISLSDDNSWSQNPAKSSFTQEEIDQFSIRSRELNKQNAGDQVAFYLSAA